ncbi:cation diffusion facilitator family transporter [Thermodesulfovibrio thiophilus]|uniref:cation diffusion facilitator family transporter n=1 Tax=Thermodesulfovibrio thiophilus TaxID=340095 RepID=UPI0003F9B2EF|nr:cation diffusion facilitator family transporter [Thermodesulfovibrio thiophilus]
MEHSSTKKLFLTLVVTFLIFLIEIIGGILSNSLALLSDAGHVFTDALAIVLSLIASIIMKKPSGSKATFGYQRIGILTAFINGISLIIIAAFILIEGYKRLIEPPLINYNVMLPVAVFGFLGNLLMAWILGHRHEDLNIKSAWLHVIGDTISSFGVIVAALIIRYTGWLIIDPIMSGFVGLIIITGGVRVLKDSLWIFLELVPKGFNVEKISNKIKEISEVVDIHDVHIWSIGSSIPAFSAHVVVKDCLLSEADRVRKKIEGILINVGIKHSVIQIESVKCDNSSIYCDFEKSLNYLNHSHS